MRRSTGSTSFCNRKTAALRRRGKPVSAYKIKAGVYMKISIMLESLRLPFEDALKTAAQIGADALQITAIGTGLSPLEMSRGQRREFLSKINAAGLSVSAICGDLGGHGFTIRQDNPWKIEKSKRIAELALELGTDIITTHIGVIPADKGGCYPVLLEACGKLGQFAESIGALFAIETGPETPEVLGAFIDELGTGGIAVNYDPANLVMVTGSDPIGGVYTLKGKIAHVHAKDGIMLNQTDPKIIYDFFAEGGITDLRLEDYFKELPLGKGNVDIPAWLSALDETGYSGFVTVEREVGENPVADIKNAVEYLKTLIR